MGNESTNWKDFIPGELSGRNRRLLNEWKQLDMFINNNNRIEYKIIKCNQQGLPTDYLIIFHILSICGVMYMDELGNMGKNNPPIFAKEFMMRILLPENYPCIEAKAEFKFMTHDFEGKDIPHPWHPNIRYFGEFAGRVCLNTPDTYAGLAWCVERVTQYLYYDRYHAIQEPPYPEDFKVAEWVIKQGEPNNWIYFDQE